MNENLSYVRVGSFIDSWALKRDQFVTALVHHEAAYCKHSINTYAAIAQRSLHILNVYILRRQTQR